MATVNLLQGTAYNSLPNPFFTGTANFGQYNFKLLNPADVVFAATSAGSMTEYTFPPDLPKYYFAIIECDWAGSFTTAGGLPGITLTFEKLYRLPLPSPLIEGKQINYDGGSNWLSTIGGALPASIQAGINAVTGLGGISGLAVNDLKSVTLKAPQYLIYNHSFKLVPKTFAESQTINDILWSLKAGMHPTMDAVYVMRFPKIYLPMFIPNMKYLFKFKPCVIQALSIDFEGGNQLPAFYANPNSTVTTSIYGAAGANTGAVGAGGFGSVPAQAIAYAASDNPPESVILNIQWLELEYWLRPDFVADSNPFNAYNWFTNGAGRNQAGGTTTPSPFSPPPPPPIP